MAATTSTYHASASSSLNRIEDVTGSDLAASRAVSRTIGDSQSANSALRDAVRHLHQNEEKAWARYAADLEQATVRFDSELDVAAARLRAEQANSRHELEDALEQLAAAWRGRADALRLKAHLAEMEVQDAARHAFDELDRGGRRVTTALERVRDDAGQSLESLRGAVRQALDEIGAAITAIGDGLKE